MGIPKGWTWPCVPCVCYGSLAVEKGPGAEQEELENPRGSIHLDPAPKDEARKLATHPRKDLPALMACP